MWASFWFSIIMFGLVYLILGDAGFTTQNIFSSISTGILASFGIIYFFIWLLHIVAVIYDHCKTNASNGDSYEYDVEKPGILRHIINLITVVFGYKDDEYSHIENDKSTNANNNYSSYSSRNRYSSYNAASTSSWTSDENREADYFERLRSNNSLTDERGYMRDGKAEELVYQLEKAKRLGRLTDDQGFIIDEDYVLNRRDHYDPDEEWEEKRNDDD